MDFCQRHRESHKGSLEKTLKIAQLFGESDLIGMYCFPKGLFGVLFLSNTIILQTSLRKIL